MLCENFIEKVKVKMSFGHKTVISSLSKPNTIAAATAIVFGLENEEMTAL